ncbi:MAG TPA: hypothetical protein VF070_18155 [Streptosporangiaceae bacterium]
MNQPVFELSTPRLRAARGVTVATDVALTASPPLTPLLKLSTAAVSDVTPVASQVAWLAFPGATLIAVAAFLTTRLFLPVLSFPRLFFPPPTLREPPPLSCARFLLLSRFCPEEKGFMEEKAPVSGALSSGRLQSSTIWPASVPAMRGYA